ncbi:hypothetical protein FQV37_2644 [Psychrobacter nivimaris]|uniref:Uncharacterized protein n=1 Tax=Psychrobacter nivimaris TaxID=281738 RepID=A0A6N7C467_9GAMM|nr:hypothetical protein FQV37_2644 [Psychrobacter nivimaris]
MNLLNVCAAQSLRAFKRATIFQYPKTLGFMGVLSLIQAILDRQL